MTEPTETVAGAEPSSAEGGAAQVEESEPAAECPPAAQKVVLAVKPQVPLKAKPTTTTTSVAVVAARARPTSRLMPKTTKGVVASSALTQTKVADKKPIGIAGLSAATNGGNALSNGVSKKPPAGLANGAKARTTGPAARPAFSTTQKPSASAAAAMTNRTAVSQATRSGLGRLTTRPAASSATSKPTGTAPLSKTTIPTKTTTTTTTSKPPFRVVPVQAKAPQLTKTSATANKWVSTYVAPKAKKLTTGVTSAMTKEQIKAGAGPQMPSKDLTATKAAIPKLPSLKIPKGTCKPMVLLGTQVPAKRGLKPTQAFQPFRATKNPNSLRARALTGQPSTALPPASPSTSLPQASPSPALPPESPFAGPIDAIAPSEPQHTEAVLLPEASAPEPLVKHIDRALPCEAIQTPDQAMVASNLNEEVDQEASLPVSVSEMTGTTQPTEESRPRLAGPVAPPGVLESTDELEGIILGTIDFDKEDYDDNRMDVCSELVDAPSSPRHNNKAGVSEGVEDDDDVEMASEAVTESGLESYGNADEDYLAEDNRLDNLNCPPPPPPQLPSAPWDQPDLVADPWAPPLQAQQPLDQADRQTGGDEAGSAPMQTLPSAASTAPAMSLGSDISTPEELRDSNQAAELQPDPQDPDQGLAQGDPQSGPATETEEEMATAEELPPVAPTSPDPSSCSSTEASETEGEALLDQGIVYSHRGTV